MAASMVGAVVPATVGAADATKGFAIKTYDINNPSSASGKSTITINKADIPADGYVLPSALYYSEATNNSTGSLLVGLTTDSKDIKFELHDPTKGYTSEKLPYTLGGVDFNTNCYLSFAGFCKNARSGYKAAGKYVFGVDESQTAAGTDNYFIGCSWMNNGTDYAWAGEKSDSYPFYVFDTIIPQNIKAGTYKVTFCDYNTDATGVNDNPSPMVESGGERYTKKAGNLKLDELTIVVKGDPEETTTTTKPVTTTTTTTKPVTSVTTVEQPPVVDGDVKFSFVDSNGKSNVTVDGNKGAKIDVDVNIEAGNNDISALDVQFKASNGIKISEILDSAMAFEGVTVSSNLKELRASYATLDGDKPMKAENGSSAFMLTVDVPAGTPAGTYTVGFDSQCKVFKDNTNFNYKTGFAPLTITVEGTPSGTVTQQQTTKQTTTTTTAPYVSDADVDFAFVDSNGKDTVTVDGKKGGKIDVDVNINAGKNDISALDVQFKASNGIKIAEILDSAMAFEGVTVSSNIKELRASYATLDGDKPMKAENGSSAFMLTVEVPAGTPAGTYYVDFDSQCKVFKDNTNFNYKTSSKPLKVVVTGDDPIITTEPIETTPVVNGDVNFKFVDSEGKSKVTVDGKKGAKLDVDVNIEAGSNDISALDVQFKASNGIKISEILDSAMAFEGVTVSSNIKELRASYATLDGDKPMKAENGSSAFMLTVEVPAGTPAGTYTVGFDSQCKVFKDNTNFNYKTGFTPLTITVTGEGEVSSTTTKPVTTSDKVTTVTTQAPTLDGDVNFKFVDSKGNNTVKVKKGTATSIDVDVNIEAGTNDISALDVQFKASNGIEIAEILDSAMAFEGVTVSSNIKELRASYATLDGDKPMKAENGSSAFMLTVKVPANTPAGTYTVGFDSQCKVFKDNTNFNYKTGFAPLTIIVEDEGTTTSTKETTTSTETTTSKQTTTSTVTSTVTTTTTTPPVSGKLDVTLWGDTNCDGVVNVADVVVLNRLLNDPAYTVKHPVTKADVTAQGKVNADVVAPQNKTGKGINPADVKLTGADSEAIAMSILEKGTIPQD